MSNSSARGALACGLDFGTTNSTLGLVRGGVPELVPLEDGRPVMPTALFFSVEDNRTYFGRTAVREYVEGAEGRLMRALKSVLGSSLMAETTRVGRQSMSFVDIIGLFLRQLRERLETEAGGTVERVVLGRPVHFVDGDETADKAAEDQLAEAARRQGFTDIAFQFEPVAAALNYEREVTGEELALVVDIGGGTSDFSVIRLSPEAARRPDRKGDVLANTGVHIGGTDFDKLLSVSAVMPSLGLGTMTRDGKRQLPVWYFNDFATWHRINTLYDPKVANGLKALQKEAAEAQRLDQLMALLRNRAGHRLAGAVETAKIELTDAAKAAIRLREPDVAIEVPVTREAFESSVATLVAGITGSIDDALTSAGITAGDVQTVLLTGGSTQIPVVHRSVVARFSDARIVQSDAFGSVGLGLAVDAARKFG
ncbi:Hsp70 family protein [Mangrovicella endophytica]|uniref:Hsp70 family protein n=1 Tax=Mangrovicella endophytica TaxID=2066697 RepID=UPI000C9E34A1|nr:Hsp70 family protein [Mangrovicella endophytica]